MLFDPDSQPWERQSFETSRAWLGFSVYRLMGPQRSLEKVSQQLHKSKVLLGRWSRRYDWVERAKAWDCYEAKVVNEKVLAGTASMRERQVALAMQMQARAQRRILTMTEAEVRAMTAGEVAVLMRASVDIERRARDVPKSERPEDPALQPVFNVQIIGPPKNVVAVQLGDGRYGYVAPEHVERFRRDFPDAVVLGPLPVGGN
jgi:hypothetical protein